MARRISLPVFDDLLKDKPPTLENARKRLGGKSAGASMHVGTVVRVDGAVGIVLHARDDDLDVLLGAQMVKRTKLELTSPADASEVDAALLAEVRMFATVDVGQRVRFSDKEGTHVGIVVEKCRYGALVAKDDGRILAVGFRKLWPLPSALA